MREYVLVPKNQYDISPQAQHHQQQPQQVPDPQPATAAVAQTPIQSGISSNQVYTSKPPINPPLTHVILAKIKNTQQDYVSSLVNLVKDNHNVKWDTTGQLYEPIRGYNIIDLFKMYSDSTLTPPSTFDISSLQVFHATTGLDVDLIKNYKLKIILDPSLKSIKKKKKTRWWGKGSTTTPVVKKGRR